MDSKGNEILAGIADNIIRFSEDAILSKTLEGIITSWNHGAEKIFGYTPEEAIGKHITMLIPPERIDEEPQIIEKVRRGESIEHYETQRIKKDGTIVYISLTVSPLKDADGRIIGVSKIARDISGRRKADEIQSRLAAIINFSDDAILSKTLDGILTSWNRGAEKIFGYIPEEVIGKHVSILIPPERFDEEPKIIERIRRGESIDHYETVRVRKDGSRIHISLSVSPVMDSKGNIIGVSKIARDISDRKKKEEEIIQLNKELEAFSYSVSHDLRAPLRAIHGYARMLLEDHTTNLNSEGIRLLNAVQFNAKRMGQLVDDLLAFSRLGKIPLNKTFTEINNVVEDILKELNLEERARYKITVHPLGTVSADKSLLRQVFQNLIANSIKYSSKKDHVEVEIGIKDINGQAIYYVKDNGAGFDMAYYHKLFGVFQRLHDQDEYEGTGVGLSIVQRVIERHGGKIWAEGKVNEGATFYFTMGSQSPNM